CLKVISTGAGTPGTNFVRQFIPGNNSSDVFTLSFWFHRTAQVNDGLLYTRTAPGSAFIFPTDLSSLLATPGQSNSVPTDLPPYDPIWLNEISSAEQEPWLELFNTGTNAVSFSNYFIADNYSGVNEKSLASYPPIEPHQFMVVPLPVPPTGALALKRRLGTHNQIVDYFNYNSPFYGALP